MTTWVHRPEIMRRLGYCLYSAEHTQIVRFANLEAFGVSILDDNACLRGSVPRFTESLAKLFAEMRQHCTRLATLAITVDLYYTGDCPLDVEEYDWSVLQQLPASVKMLFLKVTPTLCRTGPQDPFGEHPDWRETNPTFLPLLRRCVPRPCTLLVDKAFTPRYDLSQELDLVSLAFDMRSFAVLGCDDGSG